MSPAGHGGAGEAAAHQPDPRGHDSGSGQCGLSNRFGIAGPRSAPDRRDRQADPGCRRGDPHQHNQTQHQQDRAAHLHCEVTVNGQKYRAYRSDHGRSAPSNDRPHNARHHLVREDSAPAASACRPASRHDCATNTTLARSRPRPSRAFVAVDRKRVQVSGRGRRRGRDVKASGGGLWRRHRMRPLPADRTGPSSPLRSARTDRPRCCCGAGSSNWRARPAESASLIP